MLHVVCFRRSVAAVRHYCLQPTPINISQVRCKMTQQRKFKQRVETSKVSDKFVSGKARLKGKTGRDNVIPKWVGQDTDKVPEDDVYLMKYFNRPEYSVSDALKMHRELAQPAVFDNVDGMVYLDAQMNFKTKKKTKF